MTAIPSDPSTPEIVAPDEPIRKAGSSYIWLVIGATFGVYLAFVTPIGLSLSIKLSQIAPGHEEYLGYITGVGAIAAIVANPIVGMLSDRTRSRFGRRRPFLALGTVIGILGLVVMAQASTAPMLGLGWIVAQIGWGPVITLLLTSQADNLPEEQRGKVSGLSGMVTQFAPVAGVMMVGGLAGNSLLLFLVPGAFGVLAMALFLVLVREPDSRGLPRAEAGTMLRTILQSYYFDPRRYPDFAWNWLGKFLVFFGITLNTTFTAFFLASRMDVSVEEVAGTVAVLGIGGILAAVAGAIGGGFLSDRLRRRKIFVLLGTVVFAGGVALMALAPSVPLIMTAAILGNLGLGLFSSVDQALTLDVLPDKDTDAGRYMAVFSFATTLAQGVAPFIAPAFLAVGASGGEKNYTLLYLVASALTLAGGLAIFTRVKSVR